MKHISKSKRYVSVMGLMLAVSLALFVFGCSSSPTVPNDPNPPDNKLEYLTDSEFGEDQAKSPGLFEVVEVATSEVVGILGGVVEVEVDGEKAEFKVPSGALKRPVVISLDVTKRETPLGAVYVYDCGPDGTVFSTPAELSQPMPEGRDFAILYYFNESTRMWELQEVVKVKDGVAKFKIKHFSKYGIS